MKKTDPIKGVLQPIFYIEKTIPLNTKIFCVDECFFLYSYEASRTTQYHASDYSLIYEFLTKSINEILENRVFTRKHRKVNVDLQTSTSARL